MDKRSLIGVFVITILMFYHVLTLPAEINKQTKIAKWMCFFGYLFLSVAVLINLYVIEFFKFHYSMLAIVLLPGFIFSLIFERQNPN